MKYKKNLEKRLKKDILNNINDFKGMNTKNKQLKKMMLNYWVNILKIEIYKNTSKDLKEYKKTKKNVAELKNNLKIYFNKKRKTKK